MSFEDYFKEVTDKAVVLGYDKKTVNYFLYDIKSHYEAGLSVDECVELEF